MRFFSLGFIFLAPGPNFAFLNEILEVANGYKYG